MAVESRSRDAVLDISRGSGLRGGAARSVGLGEADGMVRLGGWESGLAAAIRMVAQGPGAIGFHACPGARIVAERPGQQDAARRC